MWRACHPCSHVSPYLYFFFLFHCGMKSDRSIYMSGYWSFYWFFLGEGSATPMAAGEWWKKSKAGGM
jgi:hypothetical protein